MVSDVVSDRVLEDAFILLQSRCLRCCLLARLNEFAPSQFAERTIEMLFIRFEIIKVRQHPLLKDATDDRGLLQRLLLL